MCSCRNSTSPRQPHLPRPLVPHLTRVDFLSNDIRFKNFRLKVSFEHKGAMRPSRICTACISGSLNSRCSSSSSRRSFSTTWPLHQAQPQQQTDAQARGSVTAGLSPRWLSDLRWRIGRCIQFGCSQSQVQEAGLMLKELARDWREMVAGSEGLSREIIEKQSCRLWSNKTATGLMWIPKASSPVSLSSEC